MTVEEAIRHLQTYSTTNGSGQTTQAEHEEAKQIVIKALSQQTEDAISRQAALDAFGLSEKTRKYGGDHSGYGTMMLYEIQQTLEDLPSVTPKQRTGHWIRHTDASGNSWHTCPACGHVAYTLSRFCPDCGARLEAPS